MAMTLKPKSNCPNGSVQKSQDCKKHVKFGQMWRFYSLFSSIARVWCIMNSCHEVVRSLRNTTLKLCADCVNHFVSNAQNSGKTNHGFCTMIKHQLTHRMPLRVFLAKNKTVIMLQPLNSLDWSPPMKGERFPTIEEIKEKSQQELLAIPKSSFQKCCEYRKKAGISVLYLRRVIWRKQSSYW